MLELHKQMPSRQRQRHFSDGKTTTHSDRNFFPKYKKKTTVRHYIYIQGEAHKVLQSNNTQTIDHIQKCFRQKFQFLETAVIPDHTIFLSVEVLKLRQGQLHFLKWNHVLLLLPITITDYYYRF